MKKSMLIYSEVTWDFLDQRHHKLARYAAKNGYHVEFIQRVTSRIPPMREIIKIIKTKFLSKNSKITFKEIPNNIELRRSYFLPTNFILGSLFNWFVWFFLERPRQEDSIIYSFVNNPQIIGGKFPFLAKHSKSFFDVIHNWWDYPWYSKKLKNSVDDNLKLFDEIITDSLLISSRLEKKNIVPYLMLPGVESSWIGIGSKSDKICPVFFGNLRANSDLSLLDFVNKEYGLDIFGCIDETISNNKFTHNFKGQFGYEDLIEKLKNYNLILLPYNEDRFSKTISPAKYFEALATGALVITCSDLDHLPGFDQFILKVDLKSNDINMKINNAFKQQEKKEVLNRFC